MLLALEPLAAGQRAGVFLPSLRNSPQLHGFQPAMTKSTDPLIRSGAAHVEEEAELAAGQSAPREDSYENRALEDRVAEQDGTPMLKTELADLTLSMFTQGGSTRVRVGNPHNASELYEYAFESADEANTAMLDAGILQPDQVADMAQPAGTGIALTGITAQQLEGAGLKRRGASTI